MCCIAVKKYYNQWNSYQRKHLIGGLLSVSETYYCGGDNNSMQADMHGSGAAAKSNILICRQQTD